MEEIKSIQKRAKEYTAKWNEFRREFIDKEFTRSYLANFALLPYRSRVAGSLCNNSIYTKFVRFTGEDQRIKVYKFTDNPIHYSFFQKIISDAYEYSRGKKRKSKSIYNSHTDKNKETESETKTETETKKPYTENEIALRKISDRELVAELYKRGYTGRLTQAFDLDNPNF